MARAVAVPARPSTTAASLPASAPDFLCERRALGEVALGEYPNVQRLRVELIAPTADPDIVLLGVEREHMFGEDRGRDYRCDIEMPLAELDALVRTLDATIARARAAGVLPPVTTAPARRGGAR